MLKFGRCYHRHEARIKRCFQACKRWCMYIQIAAVACGGVSCFFTYRIESFTWDLFACIYAFLSLTFYFCWCLARLQLDAAFHLLPEHQEGLLVTTGLYTYCSHPLYMFSSLCLCSYVLLLGRPILLLAMIVVVPVQMWRAQKETEVLRALYGDVYQQYIQTVIM